MIEYSSNYLDATGGFWFCFKGKGTIFNADIADTNNFKSFNHKTKLIRNAAAANEISENATISVSSLRYLSNFWRSLDVSLIDWNNELKLRWVKHCVLVTEGIRFIFIIFYQKHKMICYCRVKERYMSNGGHKCTSWGGSVSSCYTHTHTHTHTHEFYLYIMYYTYCSLLNIIKHLWRFQFNLTSCWAYGCSIFKLIMLIKNGILLKIHVSWTLC